MPSATAHAVVLLPPCAGSAPGRKLRRWLARGRVLRRDVPAPGLARVLTALGRSVPETGLAAIRYLGDTGRRCGDWLAAADLVQFEAGLNRVFLHRVPIGDGPPARLAGMYEDLQQALGGGRDLRFVWSGRHGYIVGGAGMATAGLPPECIDGEPPDDYLPVGGAAAAYEELTTEIQMQLHERAEASAMDEMTSPPGNALWLWGGGRLPALAADALPPLYGDDALCGGYWQAAAADRAPWPGSLAACATSAGGDFVAIGGAGERGAGVFACLDECRRLLADGAISTLTLLFAGGTVAEFRRADRWRLRARNRGELAEPGA